MKKDVFNTALADAQGSRVSPISPCDFDFEEYADYEQSLLERCRDFDSRDTGSLVYRRFRVPEVYSWGCADRKHSLEMQLGALKESMNYMADVPNFLEPWYGIGTVSSAFGVEYIWKEGQAPAVEAPFQSAREALDAYQCPVEESPVGRRVLEMIEYFLEETKGKLPISLSDTQSPLNIVSSYLLDSSAYMYEIYDNPEDLKALLNLVGELQRDFLKKQRDLIGNALVKPGHGFASSRVFRGVGFSDDNILMFGDDHYLDYALAPLLTAAGDFEGPVFHSCGNWTDRSSLIVSIPDLIMADGAVGNQTDPSPNDLDTLVNRFEETGIILHIRIVGDAETVIRNCRALKNRKLKSIVTTYCPTPEDQMKAYDYLKDLC